MSDKKIALITGANKGIGFETARQLGAKGIKILLGARDETRGREAAAKLQEAGVDAEFIAIDINDEKTHAAAASYIEENFGKLDILVNNAAVALDSGEKVENISLDTLRKTFDTNFFGVIAVTQALLPLVKKADSARIVNVSSGLGSLTLHGDPNWEFYEVNPLAYNSSKTALNAFTVVLAHELKSTNIKVNAADPGFTATDLNGHRGTKTVEEGAAIIVELATLAEDGATGGYFNDEGPLPW